MSRVSAHYYVCRDSAIFQLVDDSLAAWHAGTAHIMYENEHSIGIECEHHSGQDWPAIQKAALAWLIQSLMARHPIVNIETHGQVAIRGPYIRKLDPTDWPHAEFETFRAQLAAPPPPAPPTKRYKAKRIMISQRPEGGPPYAGELAPGEEVVVDKWYTNSRMVHIATGIGFASLDDLEALP